MSLAQEYSPFGRPQLLHVKGPAMVPLAYRPLPTAPGLPKVERDVDDDDAFPEEQRSLDEQGGLVME